MSGMCIRISLVGFVFLYHNFHGSCLHTGQLNAIQWVNMKLSKPQSPKP